MLLLLTDIGMVLVLRVPGGCPAPTEAWQLAASLGLALGPVCPACVLSCVPRLPLVNPSPQILATVRDLL
jgi:hypothetical protein